MTSVPRLGVLYEPDSVQAMHVAEAARGDWETVWLVDRDVADPGSMLRLLSRLGEVVDITGLDAPAVPGAARGGGLDGVVAFDDKFLCRAAAIADEHGLATYGSKVAERLTDKELQRAAFRAAGLPTPGSVRLLGHDGAGGDDAVRGLRGQLVVKPATGSNGSRDVFLVEGPAAALELMAARRAAGLTADMVAEERIPDGWGPGERPYGDFVTVEVFGSGGGLSVFGVTGCMPYAPGFALTGNFMPNALDGDERAAVTEAALRAITALGGGAGVYHTEVKLSADGPRVIEVNGRLGGGGVPRIAELATGRSLIRDTALIALGHEVDMTGATYDRVAYYHRIQPPLGATEVESITGVDAVRRMPGVVEVEINHRPGESLGPATAGTKRYVYSVHGSVASHEELWATLDSIVASVDVTFRRGGEPTP